MEHIVYILGSGFSAPLGIPVMKDFFRKAKEIYYQDRDKHSHFDEILKTVDPMHKVKTYFETDLLNIEEVLSILDMEDYITGNSRADGFARLISGTIKACTPPPPEPSLSRHPYGKYAPLDSNFVYDLFGNSQWNGYAHFVCSLLNLKIDVENFSSDDGEGSSLIASRNPDAKQSYAIVTLNYDLVVETMLKFIKMHCNNGTSGPLPIELPLAKLHGSVDGPLVAPTWRKWTANELSKAWTNAYDELRRATQIRILGYSLPVSDTYVRYLMEAAYLNSEQLKNIDIISLDDDNHSLRDHYEQFICYKFRRFKNANIRDYLQPERNTPLWSMREQSTRFGEYISACFDGLEKWHEKFMTE